MIKIIVIISFLLDGLLSIYREFSLFNLISLKPMFTIVALVVICPLYFKKDREYYQMCILIGLLYDVLYTNTPFFNMLVFLLMGFITKKLYMFFNNNLLNSILINIIILVIYNTVIFFVLTLIGYLPFKLSLLAFDMPSVIITNTVFFALLYEIVGELKRKRRYGI